MRYPVILSRIAGVALVCAAAHGVARAQTAANFTLDMAAPNAPEATFSVAAPTTVSLKIVRSGGPVPAGFAIDLSPFTNAQGTVLPVSVSVEAEPDSGATHVEPAAFNKAILPVNLHIKAFPSPGRYTGTMTVTTPQVPGTPTIPAQAAFWRINLTSAGEARPATLAIDQNALTLTGAKAFCLFAICLGSDDPLALTLHLRDKSGNWPLNDITARQEPGVKVPSGTTNWSSHLTAKFNGTEFDLFSPRTPVAVAAHQQGTVDLDFSDLSPGEYTIPLRFVAANSSEDDAQKVVITLQVHDSLIPAVLVLVLAALFSYFATRVVSTLRERAQFLARVRALRPLLANQPDILPVIWVRATLRLAETLSNRILMTGRSELDARLAAATTMLSVLDRVRQVRGRIGTVRDEMIRHRAIWRLERIVGRLGAAPLNDQELANCNAELDQLEGWCDPKKMEDAYWEDALPVIQSRCVEVKRQCLDKERAPEKLAQDLIGKIEAALDLDKQKKLDLNGKIEAEVNYERLTILWHAYQHKEHGELVDKLVTLGPNAPLTDVRATIDDHWWDHLTKPEAKATITASTSELDPWEAYEPVTFRVETPGMPSLLSTYLMTKKLTYHWTIIVRAKRRWGKSRQVGTLEVVSTEPQVAQFSPVRGQMEAEVKIAYDQLEGPGYRGGSVKTGKAVEVKASADFGIFAKYEFSDLIAFALAAAASIASGLALYVLKPTFYGSVQDYLTLFVWGASIDQGKNFLQSLGAYSGK